jgi:uncharacterized membrane protein
MSIYLLALAIGVVAGLRAMTVPAAVSWAAHLGLLDLHDTWLALVGTLAGHAGRARLAMAFGRDRPAALLEDAVAVAAALLIVVALP